MKIIYIKNMSLSLIILFLVLAVSPMVSSSEKLSVENILIDYAGEEKDLVLLRAEHYLFVDATEDVSSFHIRYAFPPEYGYQTPMFLEMLDDTTANIINYKIEDDTNELNKIVNFTIGSIVENKSVLLHFNYYVITEKYGYEDLPDNITIPEENELPEETKKWLSSTEVVQANKTLIKLRARQLRGFSNDLLRLAYRTAKFTRLHRYPLFLLQFYLQKFIGYRSQDALTTLLINGECPGRSNLGCALFRANGVPARVVLAMPSRQEFWYEMHYMTEYYCPGYEWILTDVHPGVTPVGPEEQVVLRICYPEDENNTGVDFMYPKMKGLEQWLWIDNENVHPYYVDCKEGSKIKSFAESEITTSYGDSAVLLTKTVFSKYECYLGMALYGENLEHFKNAVYHQKEAISLLKANQPGYYLYEMLLADIEYDQINI